MTKFFTVLSIIVGSVVLIALYGVGQAWIVQRIWTWYAVSRFHLPALGLGECYVLLMTFRMMGQSSDSESFKKDPWAKLAGNAFAWLLLLGVARWLR